MNGASGSTNAEAAMWKRKSCGEAKALFVTLGGRRTKPMRAFNSSVAAGDFSLSIAIEFPLTFECKRSTYVLVSSRTLPRARGCDLNL